MSAFAGSHHEIEIGEQRRDPALLEGDEGSSRSHSPSGLDLHASDRPSAGV